MFRNNTHVVSILHNPDTARTANHLYKKCSFKQYPEKEALAFMTGIRYGEKKLDLVELDSWIQEQFTQAITRNLKVFFLLEANYGNGGQIDTTFAEHFMNFIAQHNYFPHIAGFYLQANTPGASEETQSLIQQHFDKASKKLNDSAESKSTHLDTPNLYVANFTPRMPSLPLLPGSSTTSTLSSGSTSSTNLTSPSSPNLTSPSGTNLTSPLSTNLTSPSGTNLTSPSAKKPKIRRGIRPAPPRSAEHKDTEGSSKTVTSKDLAPTPTGGTKSISIDDTVHTSTEGTNTRIDSKSPSGDTSTKMMFAAGIVGTGRNPSNSATKGGDFDDSARPKEVGSSAANGVKELKDPVSHEQLSRFGTKRKSLVFSSPTGGTISKDPTPITGRPSGLTSSK